MKNLLIAFLSFSAFFLVSCDDDMADDMHEDIFEYHAHVRSPNPEAKKVGDTMHIHVDFESHTGEVVHHVRVRILKSSDSTVVYDMPSDKHVHSPKEYSFHDNFALTEENGITGHSDWILEASVWGHDKGMGLATMEVPFHVHPR